MSETSYDFKNIERKWQDHWRSERSFCTSHQPSGKSYYALMMYPYPSGVLHLGHVINYSLGDSIVRYHIMKGESVLSPMGWDSFGLPAENYAIKHKRHPEITTRKNIERMREQCRRAGWAYDFERELATSHPGYYRWTQWLFLQFYKAGKVLRKKAPVNWCPSCQTVLANEQVHAGNCERCDTEVEQKDLVQWFFQMSSYAQRLLDGHQKLRGRWPENVLRMQEEWIGRSEGTLIVFKGIDGSADIPVFTTRPDTIFGVTYMAIPPEHPHVQTIIECGSAPEGFERSIGQIRKQSTIERSNEDGEKIGVFTGSHVINPLNKEKIQVWVANYALMDYGTGAVMAVPAHDQRDFDFARKYGLPVKVVIQPEGEPLDPATMTKAYTDPGRLVGSAHFDGTANEPAKKAITSYAREKGFGDFKITYRLKDWLLSRQRYWGAPIPIIYCDHCGELPVPEEQLPVLLPMDVEFKAGGESPLARCETFKRTTCPKCGRPAQREVDTMDTFVDSSWYFLRYLTPRNEKQCFDNNELRKRLPVDQYVGGIEHATMHLIYARFFTMVLHDLGLVPFDEPFKRLFCQGMVCKTAYYCSTHKWVAQSDLKRDEETNGSSLLCPHCEKPVRAEMAKMSKTKLNGVSPDGVFDRFGADCMHLAILFLGPPNKDLEYNDNVVLGINRFINRVWSTFSELLPTVAGIKPYKPGDCRLGEKEKRLRRKTHQAIKWISHAFEIDDHPDTENNFHFNTCISQLMELLNTIRSEQGVHASVLREAMETFAICLNPFAPHLAEELGQMLGFQGSLLRHSWPTVDVEATREDTIEVVLQVNGKIRAKVQVPIDMAREDLLHLAMSEPAIIAHIGKKSVKKTIHVPNKLVNLVV